MAEPTVIDRKEYVGTTSGKILVKEKRVWYKKKRFLFPLGLLACIFLLYLLVDDLVMPLYVKRGSVATVPSVMGKKQNDAMKILSDAGYEPIQYEVRFDDKAPEGTIVRQTPEGGEQTKPGRKVYLIISGGKEMAVTPDLTGRSLRDAKMMLLRSNLSIGQTNYAYSDVATNGTVFQQTPGAGQKITTNTKVDLTVSEGPLMGKVPVPNLAKLTLAEAISKLNESKLSLGKVTFQSQAGVAANTVLDQYPPAGDLLSEGSNVDVFVSKGDSGTPGQPLPEH